MILNGPWTARNRSATAAMQADSISVTFAIKANMARRNIIYKLNVHKNIEHSMCILLIEFIHIFS